MGVKKDVFNAVGGYSELKAGEDIELSMRIIKAGYNTHFIPDAFVYHKRRTSIKKFFRQVYRFGAARINIYQKHKDELKPFHFVPALFIVGFIGSFLIRIIYPPLGFVLQTVYSVYFMLIPFRFLRGVKKKMNCFVLMRRRKINYSPALFIFYDEAEVAKETFY